MPWKKGQSGNPSGRPKEGESLTEALLKKMSINEIAEYIIMLIRKGDSKILTHIYDHIDGKAIQKTIMATEEEEPFRIIIQKEEKKNGEEDNRPDKAPDDKA